MFDNILWHVQKKNYLSFRPKNVIRKPTILLNISKWNLYHLKLSKRETEKEKAILFSCLVEFTLLGSKCLEQLANHEHKLV